MKNTRTGNILLHVYLWAFYILLNYYLAYFQQLKNVLFVDYLAKYLLVVPVFYINTIWVLPYLFKKRKYISFFFAQILIALSHYFLFSIVYTKLLPLISNYPQVNIDFAHFFPRTFWWYFNFSLYAFGYWYAKEAIEKQKEIIELQRKNFMNEFNFLKLQINPHFLYNTLNTLLAQALPHSAALADNIMKLSNMMRYSLESIDSEDGKVMLEKEIQYLKELIEIHQIRFSNELNIVYEESGQLNGRLIPALSLIRAVENAFKFGVLKDNENPLLIKMQTQKESIYFYCKNKKKKKMPEVSFGLGLINLKKRLDYVCGDRFTLKTTDKDDFFVFELTILN
jgi:hypothetical protein